MAIPCMDDEANYLVVDAYTMENINGVELKGYRTLLIFLNQTPIR